MIISKTTLAVMAIFAVSMLVTGSFMAAPSYASGGHKDKDGVSGDGNTIVIQISNGKASANGLGTEASNIQSNSLLINSK
jgi:hypothetical protein